MITLSKDTQASHDLDGISDQKKKKSKCVTYNKIYNFNYKALITVWVLFTTVKTIPLSPKKLLVSIYSTFPLTDPHMTTDLSTAIFVPFINICVSWWIVG